MNKLLYLSIMLVLFSTIVIADEYVFYEDFENVTTNKFDFLFGDTSINISDGLLISNGVEDGDNRYRSHIMSNLDTHQLCEFNFSIDSYLFSAGNPHEGNQVLYYISDEISGRRYEIRVRSGTRYIDGFQTSKDKISFGYGILTGPTDLIVSEITPSFDTWYRVHIEFNNGVWRLFINDVFVGEHIVSNPCLNITKIGAFLHGSVAIDNLSLKENEFEPPQSMLEKYSPSLYYSKTEKYFPKPVDAMLLNANLISKQGVDAQAPVTVSASDEAKWLDLIDVDIDVGYDFPRPSFFDLHPTNVYAREISENGFTALQYYLFYPFNNWYNRHEGDWEFFQIVLDEDEELVTATASAHYLSQEINSENEIRWDGTHPKLLVGSGSHANYFDWVQDGSPRDYFGAVNDLFSFETVSNNDIQYVNDLDSCQIDDCSAYQITEITGDEDWISFEGKWGEIPENLLKKSIEFNSNVFFDYFGAFGPSGPKFYKLWGTWSPWNSPFDNSQSEIMYKNIIGKLECPADLHVTDSQGRRIDLENNKDLTIPGLVFYTGPEADPEGFQIIGVDNYTIEIVGNAQGMFNFTLYYGLSMRDTAKLIYSDIPITEFSHAFIHLDETPSFILEMDEDGDGVIDWKTYPEKSLFSPEFNYTFPDEDGDGAEDLSDNCVNKYNPGQEDWDMDGYGDVCDSPRVYLVQSLQLLVDGSPQDNLLPQIRISKKLLTTLSSDSYWESDFDLLRGSSYFTRQRTLIHLLQKVESLSGMVCNSSGKFDSVIEAILDSDEELLHYHLSEKQNDSASKYLEQAIDAKKSGEFLNSIKLFHKAWTTIKRK